MRPAWGTWEYAMPVYLPLENGRTVDGAGPLARRGTVKAGHPVTAVVAIGARAN